MPSHADPELAARLAKATADLYAAAVADLLRTVARRLSRGLDRPGWAERRLLETALLRDDAQRIVDRLTSAGPREIQSAVTQAHRAGVGRGTQDLRQAGITPSAGRAGSASVDLLVTEAVTQVQSTHGAILRQADDVYRAVISEASGLSAAGARTRREAAQSALDRFAMRGVTGFIDRAGRGWGLESYTEMALRTAVGRAQIAGTLDRFRQAGQDIVIVSDAPGECGLCLVPGTVVEGPAPTGRARLEYTGDVISIATAAGKHLAGTPDHAVLTPFGWRRLQDLHPGDEVISDSGQQGVARVVPDDVQVPTVIEEAGEPGTPVLLAGPTRRDLDSDRAYREVRGVQTNGHLLTERDASLGQPLSQLGLVGRLGTVLGGDDPLLGLIALSGATPSGVGWLDHRPPFGGGGFGPSALHAGGAFGGEFGGAHGVESSLQPVVLGTGFDAGTTQVVGDGPTADAEGGAELLRALPGHVTADKIVSLGRRQFQGHVWDLSTGPSWFMANGIVTHNCRPFELRLLSITGGSVGQRVDGRTVVASIGEARGRGLFHANCFPAGVVVSGPGVRAADTRWYKGQLVVIRTADGYELPVTPNHPILTDRGWVAAGSLDEGDHVVRHLGAERMHAVGPDDVEMPSLIEEVPAALRQALGVQAVAVPASPEQFHGDGTSSGQVDVVRASSLLHGRVDAPVSEPAGQLSLLFGDVGLSAFLAPGASFQLGQAGLGATAGRVCRRHLGGALIGTHAFPLEALSLTPVTAVPAVDEPPRQAGLRHSHVGGNRRLCLPGLETTDDLAVSRVVRVTRQDWSGHVYNLETIGGWYTANSLVVSNCRHSVGLFVPGLTQPRGHPEDPEGDAARQRQREIERRIRQWKQREAVAMSPQAKKVAGAKVKEWQAEMRHHLSGTGLMRQRPREQLGAR